MTKNNPVISTAAVRGMIKKNNIEYVDANRRMFSRIANGISVWQLCDSIYFEAYGLHNDEMIANNLNKFEQVLNQNGFSIVKSGVRSYQIVKAGA